MLVAAPFYYLWFYYRNHITDTPPGDHFHSRLTSWILSLENRNTIMGKSSKGIKSHSDLVGKLYLKQFHWQITYFYFWQIALFLKTVQPQSLLCCLFHFHIGARASSSSSRERGKAQMSHKRRTLVFDRAGPKRAASSHRKAYLNASFAPSRRHSVCERSSQTETALIEPASLYPGCLTWGLNVPSTFLRGRASLFPTYGAKTKTQH